MNCPRGVVRGTRMLRSGCAAIVLAVTLGVWIGCLPTTTISGTKFIVQPLNITVTAPATSLILSKGDQFLVAWDYSVPSAHDPNNVFISIFMDPETVVGNLNEILVASGKEFEMAPPTAQQPLDPNKPRNRSGAYRVRLVAPLDIAVGTYRIRAVIQDETGQSAISRGPGIVQVVPEGSAPGLEPPKIKIVQPAENIGVAQNDKVCIIWTASAFTDGAEITISLDRDLDPSNDVDPNDPNHTDDPNAPMVLTRKLLKTQTSTIPGVGTLDPNSLDPNNLDPNLLDPNLYNQSVLSDPNACKGDDRFLLVIDTTAIPPRPDGLPYFIQAKIDDGVNPPVFTYAAGWLAIQKWASGLVDLRQAGEDLAATIFQGFHGRANPLDANEVGGYAGSWATGTGDFDGDGYDDFIVVARYGNPRGRGHAGQAYMIYGRPTRFGNVNSLNSVGTSIRGTQFHGPKNWSNDPLRGNGGQGGNGGIASVGIAPDVDLDGRPEIVFGLPDAYTYDYFDIDPLDEDGTFYLDDLPYPYSGDVITDDNYGWDRLSMVVLVMSDQELYINRIIPDPNGKGTTIDLRLVGQHNAEGVVNDEFTGLSGSTQPLGARFRGDHPKVLGATSFGETVSTIGDLNNDGIPELMFSGPQATDFFDANSQTSDERGRIDVYLGMNWIAFQQALSEEPVISFPLLFSTDSFDIGEDQKGAYRDLQWPELYTLLGASAEDHLGRALPAGDFNQDGLPDIACGAPDADRNGKTDCGVAYIVYGQLVLGELNIADHPRIEIVGKSDGDHFGQTQCGGQDFNGDGVDDVFLGAQHVAGPAGANAGFAGIIFGFRHATGERTYTIDDIATPGLPGVKFYGATANALAGAMISCAGDFNGDGYADILITAPGAEYTYQSGASTQVRKGVCYLIFGNNRIRNQTFLLNQVGTAALPGIVFVSPYEKGTADEAGVDTCFGIGDINGDGYADILIGNTTADYVSPTSPTQRRVDAGEVYIIYGNNNGTNHPSRWWQ